MKQNKPTQSKPPCADAGIQRIVAAMRQLARLEMVVDKLDDLPADSGFAGEADEASKRINSAIDHLGSHLANLIRDQEWSAEVH